MPALSRSFFENQAVFHDTFNIFHLRSIGRCVSVFIFLLDKKDGWRKKKGLIAEELTLKFDQ